VAQGNNGLAKERHVEKREINVGSMTFDWCHFEDLRCGAAVCVAVCGDGLYVYRYIPFYPICSKTESERRPMVVARCENMLRYYMRVTFAW